MTGDPLHLCTRDHAPFFYTGASCPYCALRAAQQATLDQLRKVEEYIARLGEEATRPPQPPQPPEQET